LKIAIYSKNLAEIHVQFVEDLLNKLHSKEVQLIVFKPFHEFLMKHTSLKNELKTFITSEELQGVDYMFSIGGDGTLLETVSFVKRIKNTNTWYKCGKIRIFNIGF
jgi:NAD+ kinase